jgi:hypothetical protein
MQEKVETPNTQLQKVTLLVAMHDYDPEDMNAGEWLNNILSAFITERQTSTYAAQAFWKAMQIVKVENCEVVVTNVVE